MIKNNIFIKYEKYTCLQLSELVFVQGYWKPYTCIKLTNRCIFQEFYIWSVIMNLISLKFELLKVINEGNPGNTLLNIR